MTDHSALITQREVRAAVWAVGAARRKHQIFSQRETPRANGNSSLL
ncbi:MAG: hypothetical protein V7L29_31355 [Nostoc sp.]